jgi:hypothetical protein
MEYSLEHLCNTLYKCNPSIKIFRGFPISASRNFIANLSENFEGDKCLMVRPNKEAQTHITYTGGGGLVLISVVAGSRVPIKLTKSKIFRQISSSSNQG